MECHEDIWQNSLMGFYSGQGEILRDICLVALRMTVQSKCLWIPVLKEVGVIQGLSPIPVLALDNSSSALFCVSARHVLVFMCKHGQSKERYVYVCVYRGVVFFLVFICILRNQWHLLSHASLLFSTVSTHLLHGKARAGWIWVGMCVHMNVKHSLKHFILALSPHSSHITSCISWGIKKRSSFLKPLLVLTKSHNQPVQRQTYRHTCRSHSVMPWHMPRLIR